MTPKADLAVIPNILRPQPASPPTWPACHKHPLLVYLPWCCHSKNHGLWAGRGGGLRSPKAYESRL